MHTLTTNMYTNLISRTLFSFPKGTSPDQPSRKNLPALPWCKSLYTSATSLDLFTLCFSFLIRFYGFGLVNFFSQGKCTLPKGNLKNLSTLSLPEPGASFLETATSKQQQTFSLPSEGDLFAWKWSVLISSVFFKKAQQLHNRMPLIGLRSLPHYPFGSLIGTMVMLPY